MSEVRTRAATVWQFDDVLVDPENFRVEKAGRSVELQPREFDVLRYLIENRGRVVEKQELFENLWAESFVTDNALTRVIKEIRRALDDDAASPRYIETVTKRGYRFIPLVTPVPAGNLRILEAEFKQADISIVEETITDDVQPVTSPARLRLTKTRARRRWLLATAALTLVIGAAVALTAYFRFGRTAAVTNFENLSWQRLTSTGNVHYAIVSPNGQFVAYVASEREGQTLRLMNISDRTEITLIPAAAAAYWGTRFSNDGNEIYYIARQGGTSNENIGVFRISLFGANKRKVLTGKTRVLLSPDDSRLYYTHGESDGSWWLMSASSADGSDERAMRQLPTSPPSNLSGLSPDGSKLLLVRSEKREDGVYGSLSEMPIHGGEERIVVEPRKQVFYGAQWEERGLLLSALTPEGSAGQIYFVTYPGGNVSRVTNDLNSYSVPTMSADSRTIVATRQERETFLWKWDGPGARPRKITSRSGFDMPTWTTDGRIVSQFWDTGRVRLWTMDAEGNDQEQLTPEQLDADVPSFSADGRYMVFCSRRSGLRQIWRANADGSEAVQITSGNQALDDPKFAYGGTYIIYKRDFNGFWSLAMLPIDGGEPEAVTENVGVSEWDVSPDGEWVAYYFDQGKERPDGVAVRSLRDPAKVTYLDIKPRDFLAFTPDGKSLLTKRHDGSDAPQSTIWQFPIDGGEPKILISNPPDIIYSASYSPDGKHLVWVQGKLVSDVVLLRLDN